MSKVIKRFAADERTNGITATASISYVGRPSIPKALRLLARVVMEVVIEARQEQQGYLDGVMAGQRRND